VSVPAPRSSRLFAAGCAFVFLAAHLPFLASSLEDVDSVNFALALHDFDVAAHRPHPPGYPVFVAIARLARMLVAAVVPAATPGAWIDARTLALLGAVLGALLAFPLLQAFRVLERDDRVARAATVLTLSSPLVWFNASRPLSDVAGLFATMVVLALLLTAWRRQRSQRETPATGGAAGLDREGLVASGRLIVLGALVAGFAIGVRSQTVWLTVPVLVLVVADRAGRGAAGALLGATITFAIGVLLWAVPLFWASGGVPAYIRALSGQAGEDLSGVDMLARNPTARRLAAGLVHTFVDPWDGPWLAAAVLALGVAGALVLLRRSRAAFTMLALASLPYAVFHLTFHETFTTRYALPLVPVVAYLAARGLAAGGRLALVLGTIVLAVAGLAPTVPALAAYAAQGSPVARAVADVRTGLARYAPRGRALAMNHPFSIALRGETFDAVRIPAARTHQWMQMALYWRDGGALPVWFLAEPGPNGLERHHELALIDPAARRLRGSYRWTFDPTTFVGGARPSEVDWYEIAPPGWFATEGWALTPEIAGASRADRRGPAQGGVTAAVRRRPDAAVVMVGGRNLGRADAPDVRFDLAIGGRSVRAWRVAPQPGFFLEFFTLDAGALAGGGPLPYLPLTVTAEAADGSRRPVEASVEQFDLQPLDAVILGFDGGWHEQEYAPARGLLWRWTAERATIRVHAPADAALTCTIRGESTVRYFDRPSRVALRAGNRLLGEFQAADDYTWTVAVPPGALADAGGVLTLTTDQTFVPDERSGNGDRRRLGLRVYELELSAEAAHAR
jgi:hypothetical protein